jgi:Spy/CpxP family protein refolding chaperone
MLGFILGTACLLGFIATARAGRHGCGPRGFHGGGGCHGGGYGGYEGGPWGGHHHGPFGGHHHGFGGFGGPFRGGPRSFMLRALFERLDATPGQEKVILAAIEEMRAAAASHRGELEQSRRDLAKAVRSPGFDEAHLGELFARHDAAIEAMRRAFVGAMAKVHEALDERQRGVLADLVEAGPFGFARAFGGFGGPYRGGPWG